MSELRILHTSDVHLGAPFAFLAENKREEQRKALREALEKTVAVALEKKCSVILVAGDLFDDGFAAREMDISFAARCFASAASACRVVILPGGHDYWDAASVLARERSRFESSGNVKILNPSDRCFVFEDLSLAIHGKALTSRDSSGEGLAGLFPRADCRYNVCLAHGSLAGDAQVLEGSEEPLKIEELEEGFDYLALGHWHSYRVVKQEAPVAVYSGSPELVARDQHGSGSAALVSLSPSGVQLDRITIGRRRIEKASISCTGLKTTEQMISAVVSAVKPDKDVVLELSLTGYLDLDATLDPECLIYALEESYFSVRIAGEGPRRKLSIEELLAFPEQTVSGAFVRAMLERIDRASPQDREFLEEALQIGIQLLQGRRPV